MQIDAYFLNNQNYIKKLGRTRKHYIIITQTELSMCVYYDAYKYKYTNLCTHLPQKLTSLGLNTFFSQTFMCSPCTRKKKIQKKLYFNELQSKTIIFSLCGWFCFYSKSVLQIVSIL